MDPDEEIEVDMSPFLILYKSGRIHRFSSPSRKSAGTDATTGVTSKDVVIDAGSGLAARLFLPKGVPATQKLPVLVYAHGGAFVSESAFSPTYTGYVNSLVAAACAVAVSVEYGVPPLPRAPHPRGLRRRVGRALLDGGELRLRGIGAVAGRPRRRQKTLRRRQQQRRQRGAQRGDEGRKGRAPRWRADRRDAATSSAVLGQGSGAVGSQGPPWVRGEVGEHLAAPLRGQVLDRPPVLQPAGDAAGGVGGAGLPTGAGDDGGARPRQGQGTEVRGGAQGQRVGRGGGCAVRDRGRRPSVLPPETREGRPRRSGQGGERDGGRCVLHQPRHMYIGIGS